MLDSTRPGVSFDAALETYAKTLGLLKDGVPSLTRVAVIAASDPRSAGGRQTMAAAARTLRLELQEIEVKAAEELQAAVGKAKDQGAQALYVWPSGLTFSFGEEHL